MELSEYANKLDETNKTRYLEKIAVIKQDPYSIKLESCTTDLEAFPKTRYPDIVNYFLYQKKEYTYDQIRNYKSLEAYNQMVCGWIKKLVVKSVGNYVLLLGKVMHSQRLNETMLSPWIIAEKDGVVVSAHCDCVAGLGGSCSHVGALLFEVDKCVQQCETTTVTGKRAYWMGPGTSKGVIPKEIAAIDFRPPKRRACTEEPLEARPLVIATSSRTSTMTKEEKVALLRKIKDTSSRGSVANLVTSPFAEELHAGFQNRRKFYITSHYKPELEKKTLKELQETGFSMDLSLSLEDCKYIEKETREQSQSKFWHLCRAGRITASKFKSCCRTNVNKPSLSLIKTICYPSKMQYKVKALQYGCSHEQQAITDFLKKAGPHHENLAYEQIGLFINPEFPYFGASPDGIIECSCCGMGLIEIKCPYCARRTGVLEKIGEKFFFLKKQNGNVIVDENHAYYYQVQMQLAVTQAQYCYLVAWSKNDLEYVKVKLNEDFWQKERQRAEDFFFKVIMPEILGKSFTQHNPVAHCDEEDAALSAELEENYEEHQISLHEVEIGLYEEEVSTQETN